MMKRAVRYGDGQEVTTGGCRVEFSGTDCDEIREAVRRWSAREGRAERSRRRREEESMMTPGELVARETGRARKTIAFARNLARAGQRERAASLLPGLGQRIAAIGEQAPEAASLLVAELAEPLTEPEGPSGRPSYDDLMADNRALLEQNEALREIISELTSSLLTAEAQVRRLSEENADLRRRNLFLARAALSARAAAPPPPAPLVQASPVFSPPQVAPPALPHVPQVVPYPSEEEEEEEEDEPYTGGFESDDESENENPSAPSPPARGRYNTFALRSALAARSRQAREERLAAEQERREVLRRTPGTSSPQPAATLRRRVGRTQGVPSET